MIYYITGNVLDVDLARALGAKNAWVGAMTEEALDQVEAILAQARASGSVAPVEVAVSDPEHWEDVEAELRAVAAAHGVPFRQIHITP